MSSATLHGGGVARTIAGNLEQLGRGNRVYVLTPQANNDVARLPQATRMVTGGPHFILVNTHASHGIVVQDVEGTPLGTISPESGVVFLLVDNSSPSGVWETTQTLDYVEGSPLVGYDVTLNLFVAADAERISLRDLADAAGYDGVSTADVTLTILPSVEVYSTIPSESAFRFGTFAAGSRLRLINEGTISGAGGEGGYGAGGGGFGGITFPTIFATAGGAGGTALENDAPGSVAVYVDNSAGVIRGGGGGGGGGGAINVIPNTAMGGGGGGGQGHDSPAGGPFTPSRRGYAPAGNGTVSAAGAGGTGGVRTRGGGSPIDEGTAGGAGGAWGTAGSAGADHAPSGSPDGDGGAGGAAGNAVTGDAGITWEGTGTRTGPIA